MRLQTCRTAILSMAVVACCALSASAFASTSAQTDKPHPKKTAAAPRPDAAIVQAFAPSGVLRASINLGNPVLAALDPKTGKPVGVSVDLAVELARRLDVPLELVVVKSAGTSVDNVAQDYADIGFFAVDPKRAQAISFTRPYVLIEGYYLVRNASPIKTNDQVDRAGVTVAVGKGSAYDLYLSRELHKATIVRTPTSPVVVQSFLDQHLDVAAGVKQQLESDAAKAGGLRLLGQRFMVIRQAMGVPTARGKQAAQYLAGFVEEMKTSGFVQASLARHRIEGAIVAGAND